jgi:TetR/AcrR family transcriptional regulator, regulator of cefoperazone and chloramphenicol sensitivity
VHETERRKYDSPKRRAQAETTRRELASSARRLFAERGYAATTIESIAREAGFAVQTFYSIYGSKRNILFSLLDSMEIDADRTAYVEQIEAAVEDPHRQLQSIIQFNTVLFDRAADIIDTLRSAGTADPDLVWVWQQGEGRRLASERMVVEHWSASGYLKPGLDPEKALAILWSLTGPDTYRLFVTERGWSTTVFQDWLKETLALLLLKEPQDSNPDDV